LWYIKPIVLVAVAAGVVVAIGLAIALYSMGGAPRGIDNVAVPGASEITDRTDIDTDMGSSDTNQQVAFLMNEGGFTPDEAQKLAKMTTEVLSQNSTYLNYRQSLPSGESWDVVMKVFSDQTYSPTEQEILQAATAGMQVYNMSTVFYEVNDIPAMNIRYFVPFDSMSQELLAAVKPAQSQPISARSSGLLPTAEAAGLSGAIFEFLFVGNLIEFGSNSGHSSELEQLMECAQNPTNPVTRRTYEENPQERQRTLNEIGSAQSEVSRLNTARVINVAAGLAALLAHVHPAVHVVTEAAGHWSEHTLAHLAEERLEQARRSVVPCDDPISIPTSIPAVSGVIIYEYHEEGEGAGGRGDYGEWEDKMRSEAVFSTDSSGEGSGTATWDRDYTYKNTKPATILDQYTLASSTKEQGSLVLKVEVGFNSISIEGSGTATVDMTRSFMAHTGRGWEQHEAEPWHGQGGVKGFLCSFEEVDLVDGGSYSIDTEGGNGVCRLTIYAS
jgi:hypothetical protein